MPSKSLSLRIRRPLVGRHRTGVARYYQLYELLSNALTDGTIAPGSALPSEPDLARQHRLSRTTVRRALERLEDENRIVRRRGSGTFARRSRLTKHLCLNLHSFYEDLPAIAAQTSVSVLRFEKDALPAGTYDLQSMLGDRAFVIQRLRKYRGNPYQLSTAYVPESIGRLIRRNASSRKSIITVLERMGPKTAKAQHTMSAVAAGSIAARELDVSLGTPLLRMRTVFTDGKGRVKAVYESLSRPDHLSVRAELERNPGGRAQGPWRLRLPRPSAPRAPR